MLITQVIANTRGIYRIPPPGIGDQSLPEGRYRIEPVKSLWSPNMRSVPEFIELDIGNGGSWERVDFIVYHGLLSRAPNPPREPIRVPANGNYTIKGTLRTSRNFFWSRPGQMVKATRIGDVEDPDVPPPDPPPPPPEPVLRVIPPALLAHKQQRQQHTCWCWAIKPIHGPWEGYCSFIRALDLPEYSSLPGEDDAVCVIPAMRYQSAHGMAASAIPTRLNLGKDGVQATVLAMDRDKLTSGYYVGAQYEVFEVDYRGDLSERIVWHSGVLGDISAGDLEANIELQAWSDLAGRTLGRSYSQLCDVGRLIEYPDEEFGTGRCRNQALHDGPAKDDWTVLATVQSVVPGHERGEFRVLYGDQAISGAALSPAFHGRLAEGKIEFLGDSTGGANAGRVIDVKQGAGDGTGMDIFLKYPLPFAPKPGDKLHLTSGCQRTPEACKAYGNFMNFRGFNPPGRESALRRFTG